MTYRTSASHEVRMPQYTPPLTVQERVWFWTPRIQYLQQLLALRPRLGVDAQPLKSQYTVVHVLSNAST